MNQDHQRLLATGHWPVGRVAVRGKLFIVPGRVGSTLEKGWLKKSLMREKVPKLYSLIIRSLSVSSEMGATETEYWDSPLVQRTSTLSKSFALL